MAENYIEKSELKSLSKSQLIQIIDELQNTRAIDKRNLSADGKTEKSEETLVYKRSNTNITTSSLSVETSREIHIELADEPTDHKDTLKSNVLKYKYVLMNALGSIISSYFMHLIDLFPKWVIFLVATSLFIIIDLLCYRSTSIIINIYSMVLSFICSMKSNTTNNPDEETPSTLSSSIDSSLSHFD